jgi:hypothetical protein
VGFVGAAGRAGLRVQSAWRMRAAGARLILTLARALRPTSSRATIASESASRRTLSHTACLAPASARNISNALPGFPSAIWRASKLFLLLRNVLLLVLGTWGAVWHRVGQRGGSFCTRPRVGCG